MREEREERKVGWNKEGDSERDGNEKDRKKKQEGKIKHLKHVRKVRGEVVVRKQMTAE